MAIPPTIQAASIGIPDTMLLMLLALVVFGPRRLPEIGRQIGKLMYEFRKVSNDFKFQMEEELRASEEADRQKKLAAIAPAPSQIMLDVPPHPVSERASPEPGMVEAESEQFDSKAAFAANSGEDFQMAGEPVPEVEGEVRGEPRRFPPSPVETGPRIQPPATGDPIAAQKPFRGRVAESATESGDAPTRIVDAPVEVADEGRTGAELQPGVISESISESGQEVHHA